VIDCNANYRLVLSSERAPNFKKQAVIRLKKRKGKSGHGPKGGPDTKTNRPAESRSQNQLTVLGEYKYGYLALKLDTTCGDGMEYLHRSPVPGGYKYGDLALQVGGVSDETVKYGHEF
jgi:hypothetical protein